MYEDTLPSGTLWGSKTDVSHFWKERGSSFYFQPPAGLSSLPVFEGVDGQWSLQSFPRTEESLTFIFSG